MEEKVDLNKIVSSYRINKKPFHWSNSDERED